MEPLSPRNLAIAIALYNIFMIVGITLLIRCRHDPPDAPPRVIRKAKMLTVLMILFSSALWLRVRFLQSTSPELYLVMLLMAAGVNWMMYVPIIGWIQAVRLLRQHKQAKESRV